MGLGVGAGGGGWGWGLGAREERGGGVYVMIFLSAAAAMVRLSEPLGFIRSYPWGGHPAVSSRAAVELLQARYFVLGLRCAMRCSNAVAARNVWPRP